LFEQTQRLQEQVRGAVTLEDRLSVLVVNDDLASLLAAEASLLKLGVQVHVVLARSGREALSLLLKQSFALILLDVHMPDMDGFELAAMLRENERCRHIPLVFITATMKAEADVTAGYACGALDFVFTPISAELLCGKVSAILNQFRQQRLLVRSLAEITDLHRALRTFARELENANAALEQRVQERTAELVKTNAALQAEIAARARAQTSLQQSLGEKEALLKEIHHRVKNNLQIVSSLLRLQAGQIDSPIAKAALLDMRNRVRSMALIHEHLYRSSNLATVDVAAYLKSLCHQLFQALLAKPNTVQLHLDLAPLRLDIDQAIPCGLLVNELVSNALKHAFPEARTGEVRVEFQPVTGGPDWCLRVADNGVGLTPDFALDRRAALGLQLVSDLTGQLGGRLAIGSGPGAVFAVTFTPASQPTEPPCRKSPQDTAPQDCRPPGAAELRPQEPDL
jgi:two-component sensor histidine kinase/ActR/RegA family two-component response regulator